MFLQSACKPFQRHAQADYGEKYHEMVGHPSTEGGRETAINQKIQVQGKATHEQDVSLTEIVRLSAFPGGEARARAIKIAQDGSMQG